MEIRPYRGADEAQVLDVWRTAMVGDVLSDSIFHTKELLDPNFHRSI